MLYNATHKQLTRTRKIKRLRAYITPCIYFPAILRSYASAQKKRTMIFSASFDGSINVGGKCQGKICGDLQEQPCNFCVLLTDYMCQQFCNDP